MLKNIKKIASGTLAVISALSIAVMAIAPAHATSNGITIVDGKGWCATLKLPVAPAPGQPHSWQVSTTYCQPFRWASGPHQVDVLTHGATYTNAYWDWHQNPDLYSYVHKTLKDGRATLNYDRIGNGDSTRPTLSHDITMASDAYVLHQLIGGMHFIGFEKVNSISHSYGAGVALAEAATYADVSKLALTGYLHRLSNPAVTAGNYPANQDPMFAGLGLDDGYLTTRPNVRGTSFHSPTTDPNLVAYDEKHKDLVSLTGLLDFLGQRGVPAASNISNKVHVPVLVMVGQQDAIFCYNPAAFDCSNLATVTANETPFYTAASSLKVVTVPGSGHDVTLDLPFDPTVNDPYAQINDWINHN